MREQRDPIIVVGVRTGLEATIDALGDVPESAAGLIAALRAMSTAIEADGGNAALWREYRTALTDLVRTADAGDDDQAFTLSITTPGLRPAVRDASDRGS